jgi:enoyl-CoA hydratase/3-hydroxyacyl-CoA dehydrogenase
VSAHRPVLNVEACQARLLLSPEGNPIWLDEPYVACLLEAVQSATRDPGIDQLVIQGQPGQFMQGVRVELFVERLERQDFDSLMGFVRRCRELLAAISKCPKPVVAWVDGPAVGGGCELALACHRIVAGPKAKFFLPESGLGIYPGMGGTQRLPRRVGVGLAKWMIYTGSIVPAEHAARFGLVDALAPATTSCREALASLAEPLRPPPLDQRYRSLAKLFTRHSVDALLDPMFPMPTDAPSIRAIVQLRAAAPRALRLAEAAIDRGIELPLEAGLDEEYGRLPEVFRTEDALAGLKAVGRAKPAFAGR